MPPFHQIATIGFGTEILYSFVIIACSLIVYFGTRELYELSSHKGIKSFRMAFLFFAIAYFFRSFIKFFLVYFNIPIKPDLQLFFNMTSLFLFMYFSSMAIFYLLYSVMWKKWNGDSKKIYLFHAMAIILSVIIIIFSTKLIYLLINIFLLAFVITIFTISKHSKKSHFNLYAIYLLLLIFWILNILDILIPNFFQNFQLLIYLASSGIFLAILYKVTKKVGSN